VATFVQNMSVNHGRADVFVPKKFLDRADVVTGLKQVRGEVMPECMTAHELDDVGFALTSDKRSKGPACSSRTYVAALAFVII